MKENQDVKALYQKAENLKKEGKIDPAIQAFEKVLEKDPYHSFSLHSLGSIYALKGDPAKGEDLIRKSVALNPKDAMAMHSLATIMRLGKRHQEAFDVLRAAQNVAPDNPQILLSLGEVCIEGGRPEDAVKCLERADIAAPGNLNIVLPLTNALAATGNRQRALAFAQAAITLAPENIKALETAAKVAFASGNVAPTIKCFERLIELNPEELAYYKDLSFLYEKTHQFEKAYETYKRCLKKVDLTPVDYTKLGEVAYYAQDSSNALKYLKKAIEGQPDNPQAYTFMGRCYAALGDKEAATVAFRKAIDIDPTYINAYFFLTEVAPFEAGDEAFHHLETLKQKPDLPVGDKSALGFALGRMYHGLGKYDEAFKNFQVGNENSREYFKPIGYAFNYQEMENTKALIKGIFRKPNRENITFEGSDTEKPIFILGMPRSGTTLLEQILSAHTEVSTAGELSDLTAFYYQMLEKSVGIKGDVEKIGALTTLLNGEGENLADKFLKTLKKKGGGTPKVIDKMPQNFLQVGLISILFPNAKIIHLKRNPLDVCLSIYQNQFAGDWTFANDLTNLGLYYRMYMDIMDFWTQHLDTDILEVQYEDLVDSPEIKAREIIEFCGLDWQPECLEFYKTKGKVFTTSVMQVRNPVNKKAVGKWKAYEGHLDPLIEALGDALN